MDKGKNKQKRKAKENKYFSCKFLNEEIEVLNMILNKNHISKENFIRDAIVDMEAGK